jgi:hypothetical protein
MSIACATTLTICGANLIKHSLSPKKAKNNLTRQKLPYTLPIRLILNMTLADEVPRQLIF